MTDPMAEIGIKLTDGWAAQTVPEGVLFTGPRTVFISNRPRLLREWVEFFVQYSIRFEHVTPHTRTAPAESSV